MKTNHNTVVRRVIKGVLFMMLSIIPSLAFSQSKTFGSVEYLKSCNGLGSLILGQDINQLPPQNLSYLDGDSRPDGDSCLRYQYHDNSLLALGDSASLDAVGLRTYKNKIVNIYLFFKMGDAYKVLSTFLKAYGPSTGRPDAYADIYNWDTSLLSLSLRYQVKTDLGVAIFTNKDLEQVIAVDKSMQSLKNTYQLVSVLY